MMRFVFAATLFALSTPAMAQSEKEVSCGYQADVVKAVQKARADGVRKDEVQDVILKSDPDWPENFNNAIPGVAEFVYMQPNNVVSKYDLSEPYLESCLLNWEKTQKAVQDLKQ